MLVIHRSEMSVGGNIVDRESHSRVSLSLTHTHTHTHTHTSLFLGTIAHTERDNRRFALRLPWDCMHIACTEVPAVASYRHDCVCVILEILVS